MPNTTFKQLSDAQVAAQYIETKDSRYFGEIYNRYYKKTFHLAVSYTKNYNEAADLVQDIFMKILEKIGSLKNYEVLSFWIYNTARNTCTDYYRVHKRQYNVVRLEEQYDLTDEVIDIEELIRKEVYEEQLKNALATLSEDERQLLVLKYFQNYSIKDFEMKLGLKSSAIKMRLKRARGKVLKYYENNFAVA